MAGNEIERCERWKEFSVCSFEGICAFQIRKHLQCIIECVIINLVMRLHGQAVKTPPFHGGNRGSNPLGVIWRSSQVVRQWSATPVSTGSNPVCAS